MEKQLNISHKKGILYWITGLSGAGKTIIGNKLYYILREKRSNVVLLDGNILKSIMGDDEEYTIEARKKRAMKYSKLCKVLTDQGIIVICCTISMFDEVREWNRKNNVSYVEIFLDVPKEVLYERNQKAMYSQCQAGELSNLAGIDIGVEVPKNPDIIIKNDGTYTIEQCVEKILEYKVVFSTAYDRDVSYWNKYYQDKPEIAFPSPFACSIKDMLEPEKNIIDLGCGNGRDSIFFHELGLNVTGIDASAIAIEELKEKSKSWKNTTFICDDFVCSKTLYTGQYDYCYSRFSLHAINAQQEEELIKNVYDALKVGSPFFIEVRSVHDELFGKGKKVGEHEYIYEGHYRRFIKKEELEKKLLAVGYRIHYSQEKRGFAPHGNENPLIIRIIALK